MTLEETAYSALAVEPSQNQMLDINSINGRGMTEETKTQRLATIQEISIVAAQPVLLSALDDEEKPNGILSYEVQPGDVLSSIASDYGVTVKTLISANTIKNIDALSPGMQLRIPPIDGIIYKVKAKDTVLSLALKYKADKDAIISFNSLPLEGDLQVGQEIVIPCGIQEASGKKPGGPVQDISKQRFAGLPKFEGYFINPATCIITQRAHGRNGVDCANKIGTQIYAAASGVVNWAEASGYNRGYGKVVRIAHDNNTETLYGHLSKLYVGNGETVSQGQLIGLMGSTGKSTGSHVHFEVHNGYNILARNPLNGQVIAKQ